MSVRASRGQRCSSLQREGREQESLRCKHQFGQNIPQRFGQGSNFGSYSRRGLGVKPLVVAGKRYYAGLCHGSMGPRWLSLHWPGWHHWNPVCLFWWEVWVCINKPKETSTVVFISMIEVEGGFIYAVLYTRDSPLGLEISIDFRHTIRWFSLLRYRVFDGGMTSCHSTILVSYFFKWWAPTGTYRSKLGGGNSNMLFYFHPENWGKWSNLTIIFFQMDWFNHQLVSKCRRLVQNKDICTHQWFNCPQFRSSLLWWFTIQNLAPGCFGQGFS